MYSKEAEKLCLHVKAKFFYVEEGPAPLPLQLSNYIAEPVKSFMYMEPKLTKNWA